MNSCLTRVVVLAVASLLWLAPAASAQGQPQRGGQGQRVQADPNAKVLARVRVPSTHASIHSGPSTGNELLVLAPKGTEMEMVGRSGEWIQVRLPQVLRKSGIVMRWFDNETSGWMHDSTVEFLTPEAKPDAK
ncbi:MAG: hypothetical protein U0Q55_05945 [Vicinamibacterales bacterium]